MATIFNGGTQPVVADGRWGDPDGLVGPGEPYEVENPDAYGDPWTTDEETARRLRLLHNPGEGEPRAKRRAKQTAEPPKAVKPEPPEAAEPLTEE